MQPKSNGWISFPKEYISPYSLPDAKANIDVDHWTDNGRFKWSLFFFLFTDRSLLGNPRLTPNFLWSLSHLLGKTPHLLSHTDLKFVTVDGKKYFKLSLFTLFPKNHFQLLEIGFAFFTFVVQFVINVNCFYPIEEVSDCGFILATPKLHLRRQFFYHPA